MLGDMIMNNGLDVENSRFLVFPLFMEPVCGSPFYDTLFRNRTTISAQNLSYNYYAGGTVIRITTSICFKTIVFLA